MPMQDNKHLLVLRIKEDQDGKSSSARSGCSCEHGCLAAQGMREADMVKRKLERPNYAGRLVGSLSCSAILASYVHVDVSR